MLYAVGKNLTVERTAKEQKKGSVLLLVPKDEHFPAKVLTVGDKVSIDVKVGDTVLVHMYGGSVLSEADGKSLILCNETEILGTILEEHV